MVKNFFIFFIFSFLTMIQNPTPQLKVFNISFSEILFFFIHLKIFFTLIFDKSIFIDKSFGTDLSIFSTNPPPVICAAELIKFFFVKAIISLV